MSFPLESVIFFAKKQVVLPLAFGVFTELLLVFFIPSSHALDALRSLEAWEEGFEECLLAGGAGFGGDFVVHFFLISGKINSLFFTKSTSFSLMIFISSSF